MALSEILFGFSGRLARLPYFGYSLLSLVLLALAVFATVALLEASPVLGFVGMAVLIVAGAWMGLAIAAKRLHDLNMSGLHLIWIAGLGTVSSATARTNWSISVLAGLAELVVYLWLMFAPGEPHANQYGPPPA